MSNAKDDPKAKGSERKPSATVGGVGDGTEKRSGRVAYDSRGNPTWEWQLETGVYSRDVSTQRLKKLDLGELSIADTAIQKSPSGLQDQNARSPERGTNPYDNSTSAPADRDRGFNPYDNSTRSAPTQSPYDRARAAAANKAAPPAAKKPAPTRSPADMRKLDEWIKLKKTTKDKKDD